MIRLRFRNVSPTPTSEILKAAALVAITIIVLAIIF